MARTHLARAFRYIGKRAGSGCDYSDHIAHALRTKTEGQLDTLNSDLKFSFSSMRIDGGRGISNSDILDARKAGELAKKLVVLGQAETTKAEDWSGTKQGILIRDIQARLPAKRGGYYLAPSFLCFSTKSERQYFQTAWEEAKIQLEAGRRMLYTTHYTTGDNLTRRWFGTSDERNMRATKKAALKILDTIKDGLTSKPVMVCYRGRNVDDAFNLQEHGGGRAQFVQTETSGWGWSSPTAFNATYKAIGWGSMFFDANTSNQPTKMRDPSKDAPDKMMVSRGGAVIHELSHRFANTVDAKVTAEAYRHVKTPVPDCPSKYATGYGARACQALAATNPELAITNADNYRMFCEEAFVILGPGS